MRRLKQRSGFTINPLALYKTVSFIKVVKNFIVISGRMPSTKMNMPIIKSFKDGAQSTCIFCL